jgi:hypothetical protein
MKRKIRITLITIGLLVVGVFGFLLSGLYLMEIEDHYGDNQNIYFKVNQGDIAVNRDTKQVRTINKTWKRIYGIEKTDTIDMWHWLDKNTIEIYRQASSLDNDQLTYDDIDNLVDEKKLEFVTKNR